MNNDTLYQIALMTCKGMSCKLYRKLVEHYGSAKAVFDADIADVAAVTGGRARNAVACIAAKESISKAESEIRFAERNGIAILEFRDKEYPQRLNQEGCEDTPPLLFYKGRANLNRKCCVAIVGTRKATPYGQAETRRLVEQLRAIDDLLILSGLAYGIDTLAHENATENNIENVGVLGHGLSTLYPPENRRLARRMVDSCGGLLTEYVSDTPISRNQFPARNRIIAAMSDATIVVEAAERGGALITAQMAAGYHRDVFAIAGRNEDAYSAGCNNLIATGQAHMLRNVEDLTTWMGWKLKEGQPKIGVMSEGGLFEEQTPEEQQITELLRKESVMTLDEIVEKSNISLPKIAVTLLGLELKKRIICLAGKKYKLI